MAQPGPPADLPLNNHSEDDETQSVADSNIQSTAAAHPRGRAPDDIDNQPPAQRIRLANGAAPVVLPQGNFAPAILPQAQLAPNNQQGPHNAFELIARKMMDLPLQKRHKFLTATHAHQDFAHLFQDLQYGRCDNRYVQGMEDALAQISATINELPADEDMVESIEEETEDDPSISAAVSTPPAITVSLVPEFEAYKNDTDTELRMVVSMKAKTEVTKQSNVALTCILDTSGSMSGTRIDLVQETSHFIIDQLSDKDYLGFVTYASAVFEILPLVHMNTAAKLLAHQIVENTKADGSTALYDGLIKGINQLQAVTDNRLVKCGFLCTDGEATDGPTDADGIVSGMKRTPGQEQVQVHAFGFGHGHSASLLQAISDAQNGTYYYVTKSADIPRAFGDALGGLLAVAAKDIKVTIAPADGSDIDLVEAGNYTVDEQPDNSHIVSFSDIYAEEAREVLVKLRLPEASTGTTTTAMTITVEYLDPEIGTIKKVEETLSVNRDENVTDDHQDEMGDVLVIETASRYETAEVIDNAMELYRAGDFDAAKEVLDAQIEKLQDAVSEGPSDAIQMFIKQCEVARENIDNDNERVGHAIFHAASKGLKGQRAANAGATAVLPSNQAYITYGKGARGLSAVEEVRITSHLRGKGAY